MRRSVSIVKFLSSMILFLRVDILPALARVLPSEDV